MSAFGCERRKTAPPEDPQSYKAAEFAVGHTFRTVQQELLVKRAEFLLLNTSEAQFLLLNEAPATGRPASAKMHWPAT
jgi:hypothetical protein